MTENDSLTFKNKMWNGVEVYEMRNSIPTVYGIQRLGEYEDIGTIEEFKALKEKDNKDFELLLKAVKESYPMFKGAYVEFDVFMGDVMRRFTRERK